MKKIKWVMTTITVVTTVQIAPALDLGLSGAKILSFEAGKLDYGNTGFGNGYSYRGTFSMRFVTGGQSPAELELGLGLQYYRTDNPNGPTVPAIYVVRDNQLTDYFPFAETQLNVPVLNFIKIPVGARFGVHIVKQTYKLYEVGITYYQKESFRRNLLGTDFFTGLSLGHEKFPVGAQVQINMSFIPGDFQSQAP